MVESNRCKYIPPDHNMQCSIEETFQKHHQGQFEWHPEGEIFFHEQANQSVTMKGSNSNLSIKYVMKKDIASDKYNLCQQSIKSRIYLFLHYLH